MRKQVEFIQELTAGFVAGQIDPDAMARGEFSEAALELFDRYGVRVSSQSH